MDMIQLSKIVENIDDISVEGLFEYSDTHILMDMLQS